MAYDALVVSAHPDDAEVAYAETFKSQSPLLVTSPTVFLPALHA